MARRGRRSAIARGAAGSGRGVAGWIGASLAVAWMMGALPPPSARAESDPAGSTAARPELEMVVTSEREIMNLGVDVAAILTIKLSGPAAASARPSRVRATAGTVSQPAPSPDEPGRFTAIYHPPPEMRPQAVIIAVEMRLPAGRRYVAATRLRLVAPTRFPLRTSPNALVTIEVRDKIFGPVLADESGQVFVPILVPPGVSTGKARAVNAFGVAKETSIDLQNLDYPRILVLCEPEGEVGSEISAEVWGIDPGGEASPPEEMDLGASGGQVRRVGGEPGVARFRIALPQDVGAGKLSLVASMNDGSSTDVAAIALVPGPPARLLVNVDPPRLAIGSQNHASVTFRVRDRFDNPIPPDHLVARVDGAVVPVQVAPDVAVSYVPAPVAWRKRPGLVDGAPAALAEKRAGEACTPAGDRATPSSSASVSDPASGGTDVEGSAGEVDRLVVKAEIGALAATRAIPLTGGAPASASLSATRNRLSGSGVDFAEVCLRIYDAHGIPTSANHVDWHFSKSGNMRPMPAAAPGDYRAQYRPDRTIRDGEVEVVATVDHELSSSVDLRIEGAAARTVTARAGVASNLGTTLGPAVFVDAAWPLRLGGTSSEHLARLIALGLSVGYVHTELTTPSALGVRLKLDQWPVLALARVRLPFRAPAELFVSGVAGMTFANLSVSAFQGMGNVISRAGAHGVTVGLGAEAALPLDPGQLIVGARYLDVDLGRTTEQDRLRGNSLGWICDVGFRLEF